MQMELFLKILRTSIIGPNFKQECDANIIDFDLNDSISKVKKYIQKNPVQIDLFSSPS